MVIAMSGTKTSLLIGSAFLGQLAIATAVLAINGIDTESVREGLRLSARYSFVWFWWAYAGSSLATMFGMRFRRGREFGLAFAAAHAIHLILVISLYQLSTTTPISVRGAIFFSIGMMFTYLLAVLSIANLSKLVGGFVWGWLRFIGLEYIMLAFQADFIPRSFHITNLQYALAYIPFAIVGLFGTGLRFARWLRPQLISVGRTAVKY